MPFHASDYPSAAGAMAAPASPVGISLKQLIRNLANSFTSIRNSGYRLERASRIIGVASLQKSDGLSQAAGPPEAELQELLEKRMADGLSLIEALGEVTDKLANESNYFQDAVMPFEAQAQQ